MQLKPSMQSLVEALNMAQFKTVSLFDDDTKYVTPDYRVVVRFMTKDSVQAADSYLDGARIIAHSIQEEGWARYNFDVDGSVKLRVKQKPWARKILELFPEATLARMNFHATLSPFPSKKGDVLNMTLVTKDGDIVEAVERDVEGEITKAFHNKILSGAAF